MQATVELPEVVLQQLEMLARREGATPGDLIRRIVAAQPKASVALSQITQMGLLRLLINSNHAQARLSPA